MIYWRIRFDEGHDGTGWLILDDTMTADRVTDDEGNTVTGSFGYTVVDPEPKPAWALEETPVTPDPAPEEIPAEDP